MKRFGKKNLFAGVLALLLALVPLLSSCNEGAETAGNGAQDVKYDYPGEQCIGETESDTEGGCFLEPLPDGDYHYGSGCLPQPLPDGNDGGESFDLPQVPHYGWNGRETVSAETTNGGIPMSEVERGEKLYYIVLEDGTAMIVGCHSVSEGEAVTIPAEIDGYAVKSIGERAFAESAVGSVVIEEGVEYILDGAFSFCELLESVLLPSTVKYVGEGVFASCPSLSGVEIPEGATVIGGSSDTDAKTEEFSYEISYGEAYITEYLGDSPDVLIPAEIGGYPVASVGYYECIFPEPEKIRSVVIAKGVSCLSSLAFSGCTGLVSVVLPDTLEYVGEMAFEGCASLERLSIPGGVSEIGAYAFSGCLALEEVTFGEQTAYIGEGAFERCAALKDVKLPKQLLMMEKRLFVGCTSLERVWIPDSVTQIGKDVFADCAALTVICFGGSGEKWAAVARGEDWESDSYYGGATVYVTEVIGGEADGAGKDTADEPPPPMEAESYIVNFWVLGEGSTADAPVWVLLCSSEVQRGARARPVLRPDQGGDGYVWTLEWSEDVSAVYDDMDVYAVYEWE